MKHILFLIIFFHSSSLFALCFQEKFYNTLKNLSRDENFSLGEKNLLIKASYFISLPSVEEDSVFLKKSNEYLTTKILYFRLSLKFFQNKQWRKKFFHLMESIIHKYYEEKNYGEAFHAQKAYDYWVETWEKFQKICSKNGEKKESCIFSNKKKTQVFYEKKDNLLNKIEKFSWKKNYSSQDFSQNNIVNHQGNCENPEAKIYSSKVQDLEITKENSPPNPQNVKKIISIIIPEVSFLKNKEERIKINNNKLSISLEKKENQEEESNCSEEKPYYPAANVVYNKKRLSWDSRNIITSSPLHSPQRNLSTTSENSLQYLLSPRLLSAEKSKNNEDKKILKKNTLKTSCGVFSNHRGQRKFSIFFKNTVTQQPRFSKFFYYGEEKNKTPLPKKIKNDYSFSPSKQYFSKKNMIVLGHRVLKKHQEENFRNTKHPLPLSASKLEKDCHPLKKYYKKNKFYKENSLGKEVKIDIKKMTSDVVTLNIRNISNNFKK